MSFFGSLGRIGKKLVRASAVVATKGLKTAGGVARIAGKVPGLKLASKFIPGLAIVSTAAAAAGVVTKLVRGSSGKAVKALNQGLNMVGGLPGLDIKEGGGGPGLIPKGPDGKWQMPWNDPNIPKQLKQFAIDDAYLKTYYRAPHGYVVLRDEDGRPFGVRKEIAKYYKMWKPADRPPISVGDWHHLQGANRVVKKFRSMEKKAMRIANFHSPRARTSYTVSTTPGVKRIAKIS